MSIISIANQKGGVTKTTSTINVANAMNKSNKRVLLIDLDSQASLTISLGIEPTEPKYNIVNLLGKDKIDARKCITNVTDKLDVITSIIDLAQLEMELISRASREKILDRALNNIKNDYDFILIDCPPQLSILTINALSCSDYVLIPVNTDYLAYRGLTHLNDTIFEIKELINPNLKIIGIIATLFDSRVNDDKAILQLLNANFNVIGTIKKAAKAKKGILDGKSVVENYPDSEIAQEYIKISDYIIEETK